jgi:hypothetical protein
LTHLALVFQHVVAVHVSLEILVACIREAKNRLLGVDHTDPGRLERKKERKGMRVL